MVRFIYFLLITCVILAIAGFIAKTKLGFDVVENFHIDDITGNVKDKFSKNNNDDNDIYDNSDNGQEDTISDSKDNQNEADVYFLKMGNGDKIKLSTSKKEVTKGGDKFRTTMQALFSGPSGMQKISGVYSEIPPETKLLGIKEDAHSYTINISDDFEMGGGADSMKVRVKQLVTTATQASGGKDVYLEINGKRVEYVGGEGIMILQPLQRNL